MKVEALKSTRKRNAKIRTKAAQIKKAARVQDWSESVKRDYALNNGARPASELFSKQILTQQEIRQGWAYPIHPRPRLIWKPLRLIREAFA